MSMYKRNIWFIVALIVLTACTTISPFNEYAYQQDVSLKVDSLALISKSDEPYMDHVSEVESLKARCLKAYEYAKGLPKNEITTKQWEVITDSNGGSLFAYFQLWKAEGKVRPAEVKDAQEQLTEHFDQIIGLESGKVKSH
jgi:hypothetical protein